MSEDKSPAPAAAVDGRGFEKSAMVVADPRRPNFQEEVNLVERNPAPGGFPLVDPDRVGKKSQFDLVELAGQIQTVRDPSPNFKF